MEHSDTRIQLQIGQLLLVGIVIAVVIASLGGIYYLTLTGHESIYTQTFYTQKPQPLSLDDIWLGMIHLTPLGIVQFGVFTLVFTQLFRVLLVTWYFVKTRDKIFTAISGFILLVVTYSLLWNF